MKNTISKKMLFFSFAFAAISYFSVNSMGSSDQSQVITEVKAALQVYNNASQSFFNYAGWMGNRLALGSTHTSAQYLQALLELGEYTHFHEQASNYLNLPNSDMKKTDAYNWLNEQASLGNPYALYVVTSFLSECFKNDASIFGEAEVDNLVQTALLGLISRIIASRKITTNATVFQTSINEALQSFYIGVLKQVLGGLQVEDNQLENVGNIVESNKQAWTAINVDWLDTVRVEKGNITFKPFVKQQQDLTVSEFISSDTAKQVTKGDIDKAISCLIQQVNKWLA